MRVVNVDKKDVLELLGQLKVVYRINIKTCHCANLVTKSFKVILKDLDGDDHVYFMIESDVKDGSI